MINSDRRRAIVAAAGIVGLAGLVVREALQTAEPVISDEAIRETEAKMAAQREAARQAERIAVLTADPVRPAWMNRRTGEAHQHNRAKARRLRQIGAA